MKMYNTMTGVKEDFIPISDNVIKMYVCGPTVYDFCHIGHARAGIVFDTIRRYLEYRFPEKRIVFITNFTDIDDKMIKRANEEGVTVFELANRFINQYFKDFDALNIKRASYYPRATEHIPDMIKFIEKLIELGFAYETDGSVYFNIVKFETYGKLSHKKLEELQPSEEEDISIQKRSPYDFALWKKRKENEPYWDSPWGPGRPGWHIECSTMSMKYLGDTFDIHGGGLDLVFPHHENEIAQSEALTGNKFVNFFIYNNYVTINGEKMSKSLGNFFTIEEILQKYPPMALRFFLLTIHYRSPINFSEDQIIQAKSTFSKIELALAYAEQRKLSSVPSDQLSDELEENIQTTTQEFFDAMDDDFSTPKAVASINTLARHLNRLATLEEDVRPETLEKAHDTLLELCYILGLVEQPKLSQEQNIINRLMDIIVTLRNEARNLKQYEISDKIRDQLKELGINFIDYANWTVWIKELKA